MRWKVFSQQNDFVGSIILVLNIILHNDVVYRKVQHISSKTFEPCFFILVNFRHSKVLDSLINFKTIRFNILLYADFYKDIRNEKFLKENCQYFFSSKSFLNFGGPSTKFLINEFLIKKKHVESQYSLSCAQIRYLPPRS